MMLKRLMCEQCGRVDVGRNERGELYLTCDCPNQALDLRVSRPLPEEWA